MDTHESGDVADSATLRGRRGALLSRSLYEKGAVIFADGDKGDDAFLVESGCVGIFKKRLSAKPILLARIHKGQLFGEMAAITDEARSATAVALESTTVVRVSRQSIQQKIANCDPFLRALLTILINNIKRTTNNYVAESK